MIVSCPGCSARIRIDRQRHAGKRIKLKCSRCQEVFQTEVTPAAVECPQLRVLVAHSDSALCSTIGEVLARHPIEWQTAQNGHEALLLMERQPPAVAVVDVALPGLFAFELVEKVRQRPGLDKVKLILLSSVYNKMAYKRTPSSLYGADDYIEKHHIPTDLVEKIQNLAGCEFIIPPVASLPVDSTNTSGQEATPDTREEVEQIQEVNSKILRAEQSEVATGAGGNEALEKAQRLARIIVSDIALYNQDRVEEGVRSGTFFTLLAAEIKEGRRLFQERVASEVPHRDQILKQAFVHFIERRRQELSG